MRTGLQQCRAALGKLTLAIAAGCSRGSPSIESATDSAPSATVVAPSESDPAVSVLRNLAHQGLDAVRALSATCADRPAYLALRRSAMGSMEAWRRSNSRAAEAAFGPEIAFEESGGALGALDQAMTARDCQAAKPALKQLGDALGLADEELERRGIRRTRFVQSLSDSAYALGQAILESTAFVPEGDDAALADVQGLLGIVEQGVTAAGIDLGDSAAPLARLRAATSLSSVKDRAELVRATGVLGAKIRESARRLGQEPRPRYGAARPLGGSITPADGGSTAEEVSALTLPRPAAPADPERAALGEKLFFDRRLSRGGARSCASCHVPGLAYADGLVAPASLDPSSPLRRNTPSILYAPIAAALTWDGRVRTADRQALLVIHTRAEMGLVDKELTLAADASVADVGLALSAYESRTLVPATSPLDRFARGDTAALSPDARAGLDVFAGKGRCARCHVPPLFGGSRPPDFTAPIYSVIGAPTSPGATTLDGDRGRWLVTKLAKDDGAFKVPTVRNAGRTAPYFHHGRYPTLELVVDFYNRGGGRGVGVPVPDQDPDVRGLELTTEEIRVLLVFLREGLDDGSPKASAK